MDNQKQDIIKSNSDSDIVSTNLCAQPSNTNKPEVWLTNERLNLFLALCAIIISAASFYATYLQANAAERQVKAATWPWLEVMTGNFNEEKNSEEITFYIKNSGSGPAIIKYVKFFHDEK